MGEIMNIFKMTCVFIILLTTGLYSYGDYFKGTVKDRSAGFIFVTDEIGETKKLSLGKKITLFKPGTYRPLKGDLVSVTYRETFEKDESSKIIAGVIEVVSYGNQHIDSPVICKLIDSGRKYLNVLALRKNVSFRLERAKFSEYSPEKWIGNNNDLVKVTIKKRSSRFGHYYVYYILMMRKIDSENVEEYLEMFERIKTKIKNHRKEKVTKEDLIEMLLSKDYEFLLFASKIIGRSSKYYNDPDISDACIKTLKWYADDMSTDHYSVDVMGWFLKIFQRTLDHRAKPVLKQIQNFKIPGKLKKYIRKTLKVL